MYCLVKTPKKSAIRTFIIFTRNLSYIQDISIGTRYMQTKTHETFSENTGVPHWISIPLTPKTNAYYISVHIILLHKNKQANYMAIVRSGMYKSAS